MCCRGAGGNVLHKPEMRQNSSSRSGRRDRALSDALAPCAFLRHVAGAELLTHGGINPLSAEQGLNQQLWVRKGTQRKYGFVLTGCALGNCPRN